MLCYALSLSLFAAVGLAAGLGIVFEAGMLCAAGIAVYHYFLIRGRERMPCFAAFRHNNWLGAAIFAGIALDFALRRAA
jgi:4-hydroxybenzoate polyprenyltransferase